MNTRLICSDNLWALILLICSSLFASCGAKDSQLAVELKGAGLSLPEASSFDLEQRFEAPEENQAVTLVGRRGEERLKLKIYAGLNADAAKALIAEQQAMLKGLYEPNLPPYPEFLTRETGCPPSFRPVQRQAAAGPWQLLYAGQSLTYGICNEELAVYRAGVGYFSCPGGRVIRVEHFVPKALGETPISKLFSALSCSS